MNITKIGHCCLLIKDNGKTILTDPGAWTSEQNSMTGIDMVLITHEHADHYDEQGLTKLSNRFPHTIIITNNDLAKKITALKLPNPIHTGSDDNLVVFEAEHEPLPLKLPNVLNIGVHIADKLTHPGDSYSFEHTRGILALPMTAPFASFKDAMDAIVKLKPKIVLPLHDWEWHKLARESRYNFAKELLKKHKIEFIELENAEPVEL